MNDSFDDTLNSTAEVLERVGGTSDKYGLGDASYTVLASGVPCRVSLGRGRAKEFKGETKEALNYKCVFMRPWVDGSGNPLNHNHWLRLNGDNSVLYDIFQIDDPGLMGHHLEVWCQLVYA